MKETQTRRIKAKKRRKEEDIKKEVKKETYEEIDKYE
jgi:hypothetical protein